MHRPCLSCGAPRLPRSMNILRKCALLLGLSATAAALATPVAPLGAADSLADSAQGGASAPARILDAATTPVLRGQARAVDLSVDLHDKRAGLVFDARPVRRGAEDLSGARVNRSTLDLPPAIAQGNPGLFGSNTGAAATSSGFTQRGAEQTGNAAGQGSRSWTPPESVSPMGAVREQSRELLLTQELSGVRFLFEFLRQNRESVIFWAAATLMLVWLVSLLHRRVRRHLRGRPGGTSAAESSSPRVRRRRVRSHTQAR